MNRKYQEAVDYDKDNYIQYENIDVDDSEQKELEEKQAECCVAYIDILGFKDMIDNNSHLPVFALRFIKRFINNYYHSNNEHNNEVDADEFLPKATMFSDSIVISQPIAEVNYLLFINLIAQLQYGLFTKGILIRGGISCGKLYHDENYLFGKGLIKAYLFESSYADYPRIVIDYNLIEEIHKLVNERLNQSWKERISVDSKQHDFNGLDNDEGDYSCYVRKDFDDEMYIDYFSKIIEQGFINFDVFGCKAELKNLINEPEFINAKNIIETGLKTKTHQVLTKYEWLRKLYNSSIQDAFIKRNIQDEKKTLNSLLIL